MQLLNDFQSAPVASIITGVIFVFIFHIRCVSIVKFYILKLLLLFYNHYHKQYHYHHHHYRTILLSVAFTIEGRIV
jgi:hypothetical protein